MVTSSASQAKAFQTEHPIQRTSDFSVAYAARHDKTMGGTMRELVWKFLENPVINRDELVSMGCAPHSYTGPDKTANNGEVVRSGISFVSDAPALVEKFDSIAREQKLRKSELLRYILRKSLK